MRTPLVLFLTGLAVFAAFAGPRLRIHSADNHFVYLADAFLHGQTELTRKPHHGNDWASYDTLELKGASREKHGERVEGFFTRRGGKPDQFRTLSGREIDIPRADRGASKTHYYVSFPPFPAVLMMPFVAVAGYGANDVLFTVAFAALNVTLMFLLLRRLRRQGYGDRSDGENVWLTVLFAFGTVHLGCAVLGQVWFTALVLGATFNLLYIYFATDARRPLLAGLAFAAAFSTRASLLFAAVYFYWQLFFPNDGRRRETGDLVRRFAAFSAPCLAVGVSLLVYNQVRFDKLTEFGHIYLAGGTIERIRDFGLFHPHFLTRNLTAAFTLMPRFVSEAPYVQFSKHGLSMLLTTPAIFLVLWPRLRRHDVSCERALAADGPSSEQVSAACDCHSRRAAHTRLSRALWITIAAVAIPIFMYQNTGWEQFGYRFALDFLPYLVVLLAIGGRRLTRTVKTLIVIGIVVNAFGAATFKRGGIAAKFYSDHIAEEPRR
jgi:hypothetical protein